jgi:hypothetical protein
MVRVTNLTPGSDEPYAVGQMEETLSTLKFAQRAKLVKVKATANEEAVGSAAELAAEVVRLRAVIAEGAGEGVKQARERAGGAVQAEP